MEETFTVSLIAITFFLNEEGKFVGNLPVLGCKLFLTGNNPQPCNGQYVFVTSDC